MAKKFVHMNRKGSVLIAISILAGLITILGYIGLLNLGSIVGYEAVYKADWGHICCEEGAFEPAYIKYADDVPIYECNGYTDECHIEFLFDDTPWYNTADEICYDVGGQRHSVPWGSQSEITINYGQKITFVPCHSSVYYLGRHPETAYFRYSAKFRKFYIQGEENGKIYVAKSCILDYDLKQRVLKDGLNELSKTGVNRCQNYIIGFIEVATKTYSDGGNEVICQARNLYDVKEIEFKAGGLKKIQGDWIRGVECCPHESNCGENFKFTSSNVRECNYDYECANGGDPIALTGTSYVTFGCSNGKCVQSGEVQVECTNNAICVDKYNQPNVVCYDWKCVEDDSWLGHCGDGVCESILGETFTSCPNDCSQPDDRSSWWWIVLLIVLGILIVFHRKVLAILKAIFGRFI